MAIEIYWVNVSCKPTIKSKIEINCFSLALISRVTFTRTRPELIRRQRFSKKCLFLKKFFYSTEKHSPFLERRLLLSQRSVFGNSAAYNLIFCQNSTDIKGAAVLRILPKFKLWRNYYQFNWVKRKYLTAKNTSCEQWFLHVGRCSSHCSQSTQNITWSHGW